MGCFIRKKVVIGRGDIAQAIPDREGFLFYASGASNRTPLTDYARKKEFDDIKFLSQKHSDKMFVYFSTLSIYYSHSPYTTHKTIMEKLIRVYCKNYCIMRIGNITWGDNPNTLVNFLKRDQSKVECTYRYLIDKDEFQHWVTMIPKSGQYEMNITGKLTWIPDLINEINERKLYSDQQRFELLPPSV